MLSTPAKLKRLDARLQHHLQAKCSKLLYDHLEEGEQNFSHTHAREILVCTLEKQKPSNMTSGLWQHLSDEVRSQRQCDQCVNRSVSAFSVNCTYSLIQSGIDTYSIGTSSARSVRLYTNLIFWLNLELWRRWENAKISVFRKQCYHRPCDLRHSPYERFGECQQGANKPGGMDNDQGLQVLP